MPDSWVPLLQEQTPVELTVEWNLLLVSHVRQLVEIVAQVRHLASHWRQVELLPLSKYPAMQGHRAEILEFSCR